MPGDSAAEIAALRTMLRDLVALSTIPTAWVGREPGGVAAGLSAALVDLLPLDFVFVRLRVPGAGGEVDATRGDVNSKPSREIVIPIGFNGEGGNLAAACSLA